VGVVQICPLEKLNFGAFTSHEESLGSWFSRAAVRQEQAPSMYVVPPPPPPRHNIRSTPHRSRWFGRSGRCPTGAAQGSHGLRALCVPTTGRAQSSCTSRIRCARLAGLLRLFVVTYDAGLQTSSLPSSAFSSSDTRRFSLSLSQRNKESHRCLCRSFSIYGLQGAWRKS
jgi:hypothetical protein